jgi:hypothetical protein
MLERKNLKTRGVTNRNRRQEQRCVDLSANQLHRPVKEWTC